jgi:hypothetical protein
VRKQLGVVFIVGLALMWVAIGGLAMHASTIVDSINQPNSRQPGLLRTVQVVEPLAAGFSRGEFEPASLQKSAESEQGIQSTSRISIPYGITTPLMLRTNGQSILVAGHGGCTAGQQVTVQVTLFQTATAALATGQTQDVCTGVLQHWSSTAVALSDTVFIAAPAQACGVAETRDGETSTDRFEWCRDVDLVYGIYLPLVIHPPLQR